MEIKRPVLKAPGLLLAAIAGSLLYSSVAIASTIADSVSIHSFDGSLICAPTFSVPETAGNELLAKISGPYLDMKHRRFLQRCKAMETDMSLIYEAWKAGAGENDSFGKTIGQKGSSAGGKNLQGSGNGYSMSTDLAQSPVRKTISLVTREVSSIIGQSNAITYAATFDSVTGRRLSLADAFGGDKAIADKIAVYIQRYLVSSPHRDNLAPEYTAHVYDFCNSNVEDGWYITGDNLIVIYPSLTILKNNDGELFLTIPLKEL